MALHRDIYWVGRQWAVTGSGVQACDQKQKSQFDIDLTRLWDDDVVDRLRTNKWLIVEDLEKALAIARQRFPEPSGKPARTESRRSRPRRRLRRSSRSSKPSGKPPGQNRRNPQGSIQSSRRRRLLLCCEHLRSRSRTPSRPTGGARIPHAVFRRRQVHPSLARADEELTANPRVCLDGDSRIRRPRIEPEGILTDAHSLHQ